MNSNNLLRNIWQHISIISCRKQKQRERFLIHSEVSILLIPTPGSGEGNGTPLQYSCLENPMHGGAWWAAVHGVAKSWARLSDFTFTFHFHALKKEMATHSSVLAWRIPGMGEPGGLPSMESHRVRHAWSNLVAAAATSGRHYKKGNYRPIFIISSVVQSCLTLCNPGDCSTPGFPVHHQLPELAQTHVRWCSDAVQYLIPWRPLLLLPSMFLWIRVFQWVSHNRCKNPQQNILEIKSNNI